MGNTSEKATIEPFKFRNAAEWILLRCSGASLSIIYEDSCKPCRGTYMTIGGIILSIVTITSSLFGYAVFTVVNADSKVTTLEHPLLDPETKNNVGELEAEKCAVEQKIQQLEQAKQKREQPSEPTNTAALTDGQLAGSQNSGRPVPKSCTKNPPESQLAKDSNTQIPISLIIAIVSGIIWGVAIFCIDRFIISSTRKTVLLDENNDSGSYSDKIKAGAAKILMISSRLGFAIFVGSVISIPAEILAFESEIFREIAISDQANPGSGDSDLRGAKSEEESLKDKKDELDGKEEDFKYATEKNSNSIDWGAKSLKVDVDSDQHQESKQDKQGIMLKAELAYWEAKIDYTLCSNKTVSCWDPSPGLLRRYQQLKKLEEGEDESTKPFDFSLIFLIKLLFVLLDVLPVLVKTLKPQDAYDLELHASEERHRLAVEQSLKEKKELIKQINENKQLLYDSAKEAVGKVSSEFEKSVKETNFDLEHVVDDAVRGMDATMKQVIPQPTRRNY
jgi:hypothetical protein